MAKFEGIVVAAFKKPVTCKDCPCAHWGGLHLSDDYCQLMVYTTGDPKSDCELEKYHYEESTPYWCPLTEVNFAP